MSVNLAQTLGRSTLCVFLSFILQVPEATTTLAQTVWVQMVGPTRLPQFAPSFPKGRTVQRLMRMEN